MIESPPNKIINFGYTQTLNSTTPVTSMGRMVSHVNKNSPSSDNEAMQTSQESLNNDRPPLFMSKISGTPDAHLSATDSATNNASRYRVFFNMTIDAFIRIKNAFCFTMLL